MLYKHTAKAAPFLKICISIILILLMSLSMVPAAGIERAFASNGDPSQSMSERDELDVPNDEMIDVDATDDAIVAPDETTAEVDAMQSEPISISEINEAEDYEPPTSFRYRNGIPIINDTFSLQGIGTNYPTYFATYDDGNHRRSDAAHGLDVSYYQGNINWAQVAAAGIDFVIIRSSDGFTFNDPKFKEYVDGCKTHHIPFGVYHYARATNAAEADKEADHVFSQLSAAGVTPQNITYPIYYDIENSGTPNYWNLGQGVVNAIAERFIARMNAAGYKAGVYSSTSWYKDGPCGSSYINSLEYRWCAQYNSAGLKYDGFGTGGDALKNHGKGMWQFTSKGRVSGIPGDVDMDYSYLFSNGVFTVNGNAGYENIDPDGGTFRATFKNVSASKAINHVNFAIWCTTNGQDDIKWYTASRASDGSFYKDVSIKDHKGYVGAYAIHVYAYSGSGQQVGGTGSLITSFPMSVNPADTQIGAPVNNASVPVTAKGGDYACATAVSIKAWLDAPLVTSSVSASAASVGNVVWHDLRKSGSSWTGAVNIHHHRAAGTYKMETYATVNGQQKLMESSSFFISSYEDPGVPMYRLYNRITGEHFYTASTYERDVLKSGDWNYEGIGWIAASGGTPVYRLWNGYVGEHHYTTSPYERDYIVKNQGWIYEGIGWYSAGDVPIYRLYNQWWNKHHYTTSVYERDYISKYQDWNQEGIGWYGL